MAPRPDEETTQATSGVDDNFHEMSAQEAYGLYEELRSCPVQHSNALGGFYWLTRYDDVRAAAQDWEQFSSGRKGVLLPPELSAGRLPALEMDPPEHGPARKLYMEALTPGRIKALAPRIAAVANGLIDEFASAGECDLMADFARSLPVLGMCETIGLTGVSVARIHELTDEFNRSTLDIERRKSVTREMGAIVLDELLSRRADPRDDYLTRVAQAELDGRPMNEEELTAFMIGFLVAGHETTTSGIGTLLFHALSQPDLTARMLADERVLDAAIEEAVRLYPPFQAFHRTTTAPVNVGDTTVPADATVRLCYAAANRDPSVYERPDVFDPDRPTNPHLGFGFGRHVCVGARLARFEMRTAFTELLRRLPDIRLTDTSLEFDLVGGTFLIPRSCRAEFTPAP